MSAAATPAAMSHTNSFLTVSGQGEKQPHATKQSALKLTYNLPFKPSGLFLSIGARKQDTSQPKESAFWSPPCQVVLSSTPLLWRSNSDNCFVLLFSQERGRGGGDTCREERPLGDSIGILAIFVSIKLPGQWVGHLG